MAINEFLKNKRIDSFSLDVSSLSSKRALSFEDQEIVEKLKSDLTKSSKSNFLGNDSDLFLLSNHEISWLLKNDKKHWLDYLIFRYKLKVYPSIKKLLPFPINICIEPTPVCNLVCEMCFQKDEVFKSKEFRGMMKWETFTKIVDEADLKGCKAITLASRGEPLLHPDFSKMLKYLSEKSFFEIKVNTNASLLTEKICHDILSSNVNLIVFSIDSSSPEEYEEIRKGASFREVFKRVKMFFEIREKFYPDSKTTIRISGVKFSSNISEDELNQFWGKYADEVSVTYCQPRWDSYNNPIVESRSACFRLWEKVCIWYDGTLNPCDFDYKSKLSVGHLSENTIEESWNGPVYTRIRKNHLNNQSNCEFPCDRCPY